MKNTTITSIFIVSLIFSGANVFACGIETKKKCNNKANEKEGNR